MFHYQQPHRSKPPQKPFLLKVTGEGELAVQPDAASVNLGVITEGKELIAAQERNSKEIAQVIQSITSLGISKKNIQTIDYRIESNYDYEEGKPIFRGYKITHVLKVNIDELSMIGTIVDQAVKNGANYVSNVQFISNHKEFYYRQALKLAVNDAGEKAKAITETLNASLLPTPISVTESGNFVQPFYHSGETLVKGMGSTQLEPGQIQVKASVIAEFQYKPNY